MMIAAVVIALMVGVVAGHLLTLAGIKHLLEDYGVEDLKKRLGL